MKTAISIPDEEFESAEKLASRLRISRSELYRKALTEFVARRSSEGITEKLNEIYRSKETVSISEDLVEMQAKSIPIERW
jgi:predicted transcriptional regulator